MRDLDLRAMAESLTVVQMLPALEGGGVERGTLEVAKELVRRGHRSIVISAGGRLVEHLVAEGSEHVAWPVGAKRLSTLLLIPRLARFLREQRPDVLHLRSRLPAWVGYWACKGLQQDERPHLITTVHGLYRVGRYSSVMTRGERVIAVSRTIREYILKNYPAVDPGRIQVIYRGVNPPQFPFGYKPSEDWYRDWRRSYPQLQGKRVLALPGRITRRKGHEDLIHLIKRLRADGLAVHGLIVGGAEASKRSYLNELKARVIDAGLEQDLSFTGHRSDIREVMAVSDLVLSLSREPESFGRTVLEALSLGVPVIGYGHGGVGEVLDQVFPAGLVPLGDTGALQQRVVDFITSAPPVPREHPFSLQRMLDETLDLYESLSN